MVDGTSQATKEIQEREEVRQFIGIRLGNETYGIPVDKIKEITKPLQITAIPGTAPHIMGLMNLHGEILCVVDVKILFNIGNVVPADNSRVVVIKTVEGPVGVFCDEVTDIYDIMQKHIEAALSTLSAGISHYIQGQTQVESGLMGLLDIEKLLLKQEK